MSTRILVSLIALPLVILIIWLGGIWVTIAVIGVALLGGYEFYNLLDKCGYRPVRWVGMVWLALLVAYSWLPTTPYVPEISRTTLITLGLIATLVYALFQAERPLDVWMSTCIGAIYLGILLGQLVALRLLPDGLWWLLFGLFITWCNDTVAYFVGVSLGRNKLWPRLSPKKTWEGTLSGWVGAALLGGLFTWLSPLDASFRFGAFLGGVSGILALLGDLSISMLKRQAGVKDSGHLIPGHGGMLDRLDSVLFVVPFIYQSILFVTGTR